MTTGVVDHVAHSGLRLVAKASEKAVQEDRPLPAPINTGRMS